ncbi:MAG: hypothetical protein JNM53_04715 [Gemmatimonadetes bacterium]|nr:hypothetical protein [Gemmatimonadota bacterium]
MRAFPLCTVALLLATVPAQAQRIDWDGSVGVSRDAWRAAATGIWRVEVGRSLRLGVGARLSRYGGESSSYRSPDEDRPAALPLRVRLAPSVWGLNLAVEGQVRVIGPLAVGANLDLAGIATGSSRRDSGLRLEPARGSLFRYGDRDRGSLNSEYFLGLQAGSALALRAGVSHYVTGYRGTAGGVSTRYLRFDTVPFLALRWVP